MVSGVYCYQNGGQWDWFGGRLILEMYRAGFSALATAKLLEIAAKIQRNKGIFEWEERDGTPHGNGNYAGAAGVLARAVVEGLYGIDLRGDQVGITLRLGAGRYRARFLQAATGTGIGIDYAADIGRRHITLQLIPRRARITTLSLVVPDGNIHNFRINDKPAGFSLRDRGKDHMLEVGFGELRKGQRLSLSFTY
jgi:hypothetical protein